MHLSLSVTARNVPVLLIRGGHYSSLMLPWSNAPKLMPDDPCGSLAPYVAAAGANPPANLTQSDQLARSSPRLWRALGRGNPRQDNWDRLQASQRFRHLDKLE